MSSSKVSFTIRRPTPVSHAGSDSESSNLKVPTLPRHLSGTSTPNSPLARSSPPTPPKARTYSERDSSDEDSGAEDELVTAFDEFGAQRLHEKPKPQVPLVIPALKNKDWRELARKRKQIYVPPSAAAATGADGSVGGLGTRDTINSGPQVVGLQVRKRVKVEEEVVVTMPEAGVAPTRIVEKKEETEDEKALRAILSSAAAGGDAGIDGPQIDIIPTVTEDDAYRQDVVELPDSATLEDYERIPVSQFGAALLRGMGWKEGTAASRKNKGLVEPWLPAARPALLGIGAKEKEVFDDGSKGKKGAKRRPERRYVPVVKQERKTGSSEGREGSSSSRRRSPSPTRSGSRRQSRSPSSDRRKERERESKRDDHDRDRYRDRDRYQDRDRDQDRDRYKERERDRDRRREVDYDPRNRDRRRDRSRSQDRYESSRRQDKDRY